MTLTRRTMLIGAAARLSAAAGKNAVRLSIGTYGMQSLPVHQAIQEIRNIGYDGAELCLMAGWPSEPSKLDAAARKRIRATGFPIPSLIENFNLLVSEEAHRATLERIRAAAALAHDVAPKSPPVLQSVLGGKPAEWEQVKARMAERLADWARVAAESEILLTVKSHVSSASDTPEKLIWLLDQVHSPALKGIYDYGHFQLLDIDLEKSLDLLLPRSAFITVKDGTRVNGEPRFLLPGQGTIDYQRYCAKLKAMHWSGWVLVEVSRQLQTVPGYDPIGAARTSYAHLAPILRDAGLRVSKETTR